jgi:hypothetical protein
MGRRAGNRAERENAVICSGLLDCGKGKVADYWLAIIAGQPIGPDPARQAESGVARATAGLWNGRRIISCLPRGVQPVMSIDQVDIQKCLWRSKAKLSRIYLFD